MAYMAKQLRISFLTYSLISAGILGGLLSFSASYFYDLAVHGVSPVSISYRVTPIAKTSDFSENYLLISD